jgi:hypothetical protein
MVMPHLPNEILTIIVEELALQDTEDTPVVEDLTSCRLASHLLCSLATPLLFSSIELQHDYRFSDVKQNFIDRATSLNQILANNNFIATSVQNLMLEHDRPTFQDSITSALIANIIHRLTHVQDFTLGCVGTGSDYFTEFPADVRAAIQALCRSPNLRALAFLNIDHVPVTLFTTGPNLRRLRFRWIGSLVNSIFLNPFHDN